MHSSGMRTARLLTVSQYAPWPGRGCTSLGGTCLGVYLPGGCTCPGVYLPRGYLPGGCTCQGGTCLWGVPACGVYLPGVYLPAGGGSAPGGCACLWSLGGVSQHAIGQTPREQNDRQVQKYYLAPNFVCGR